jgi:hypothetical protein
MTAEVVYLPVNQLDREIELLQELGGDLNKFTQKVSRHLRHDPENKALRGLSSRLCRNSMWIDQRWGELIALRKELKRDPLGPALRRATLLNSV